MNTIRGVRKRNSICVSVVCLVHCIVLPSGGTNNGKLLNFLPCSVQCARGYWGSHITGAVTWRWKVRHRGSIRSALDVPPQNGIQRTWEPGVCSDAGKVLTRVSRTCKLQCGGRPIPLVNYVRLQIRESLRTIVLFLIAVGRDLVWVQLEVASLSLPLVRNSFVGIL
jgi:hypothetical protein